MVATPFSLAFTESNELPIVYISGVGETIHVEATGTTKQPIHVTKRRMGPDTMKINLVFTPSRIESHDNESFGTHDFGSTVGLVTFEMGMPPIVLPIALLFPVKHSGRGQERGRVMGLEMEKEQFHEFGQERGEREHGERIMITELLHHKPSIISGTLVQNHDHVLLSDGL
jgi:hypothetical protein